MEERGRKAEGGARTRKGGGEVCALTEIPSGAPDVSVVKKYPEVECGSFIWSSPLHDSSILVKRSKFLGVPLQTVCWGE